MTDGKETDFKSESNDPVPAATSRRLLYTLGLVGCVAVTAAIILAVVYLSPPDESAADLDEPAAAADPSLVVESTTPQSASSPPRPAVLLATTPVPVGAEQLKQELQDVVDSLCAQYPNLAESLHVAALFQSRTGGSSEAETLWRQCIELSPDRARYYVNLAASAVDRGDNESAVKTLQQAIDAGCASVDIYHQMAVSLTKLGRCDEAENTIRKGLDTHPQSPACWLVLGQAQLEQGKAEQSEASLRKAIELGAHSTDAYSALAEACQQQGKQEEAAELRKRFTELNKSRPTNPQQRADMLSAAEMRRAAVVVLCEAGTVHSWQGNSLESERLFLRAIALDPAFPESCRALAALYRSEGMIAEEKAARRRLVEIEPFNLVNYLNLANVLANLGEIESAEAALKAAISISPDMPQAYTTLAQFYMQTGKAEHARWYAQEAVRRQPTADGYRLLASACRLLDDEAAAEAALEETHKLESSATK